MYINNLQLKLHIGKYTVAITKIVVNRVQACRVFIQTIVINTQYNINIGITTQRKYFFFRKDHHFEVRYDMKTRSDDEHE